MTYKNVRAPKKNFIMEKSTKQSCAGTPPNEEVISWANNYLDFNITSEDSSASWIDESEKDLAENLKEHFHKFEETLYGSKPGRANSKSLTKENQLWSHHAPHLRVIGKAIKPLPSELREEVPDKDYEEIFEKDPDDLSSELETLVVQASKPFDKEQLTEKLKQDVLEKLFNQVWPRVFERVKPTIKQYFENKSIQVEEECSYEKFSPSSGSSTISGGSPFHSYLPVFKALDRSRSNKSFRVLTPEEGLDRDVQIPVRTSPSVPLKKTPLRMTQATVGLPPPQIPPPVLLNRNKDIQKGRCTGTVSARLNKRSSKDMGNENSFQFFIKNPVEMQNKPRNGLLPPIGNLEITPKLGRIRSTSALQKGTNVRNSTRLNSSRSKSGLLTPIEFGNPELHISSRRSLGSSKHLEPKLPLQGSVCIMMEEKGKKKPKPLVPWK